MIVCRMHCPQFFVPPRNFTSLELSKTGQTRPLCLYRGGSGGHLGGRNEQARRSFCGWCVCDGPHAQSDHACRRHRWEIAPAEHVVPAPVAVAINGGAGSIQYVASSGAYAATTKTDEVAVTVTRALYAAGGSDLPNISLERPAQKIESLKRLVSPAAPVAAPVVVSINGGVASSGPSAWAPTAAATPAPSCEQDVGWSLKKMFSSMFTPYCQGATYVPAQVRKPVERSIATS